METGNRLWAKVSGQRSFVVKAGLLGRALGLAFGVVALNGTAAVARAAGEETGFIVHVSPQGTVRTPDEARAAVRAIRAREAAAGRAPTRIDVVFADGLYRLETPLTLDGNDSGAPGAPIVWRAAHRGKAVLSGAKAVGWRPLSDEGVLALLPPAARGRVLVADVPGAGLLPSFLNGSHCQTPSNDIPIGIFRGAVRLTCARGPDNGFFRTGASDLASPEIGAVSSSGGSFAFDPERLQTWSREPDPWLFGLLAFYWADVSCPLDRLDVAAGRICLDDKAYVPFGLKPDMPFYVFNAFSELDRPGEWVVDRARRRVYLWPESGDAAEVVLGAGLLALDGVSDVVFDGLVLEKSRRTAVYLRDCTNVTVRACGVRHTCSWGVEVEGGRACRIVGCDMTDLGEGGIRLSGGDFKTLTPAGHVAENNRIGHFGKVFYNYRQGISLNGVGCAARHNLVHHSPHTAIYAGGNDHVIAGNVIHDTCSFNNDAGAIYVWDYSFVKRGHLIEHNVIHFTGKAQGPENTEGIYLDDFSSENVIRGNLVNRASRGLHLGGGQCNEASGNVFLNCNEPIFLATRATWPDSRKGRESRIFQELDANLPTYTSAVWRTRYPGLGKLLGLPQDSPLAHHALWNVVSNNVAAFCGRSVRECWDVISNTTVWADNVDCGARDPGLSDYFGFDWTARPGTEQAAVIAGCGFDRAGLYDSPDRLTPAVKFGDGVTPPQPWGPPVLPPTARVGCVFRETLPSGVTAFATDPVGCSVPGWGKGLCTDQVADLSSDRPPVRDVSFSFVPTVDGRFVLEVMGGRDNAPLTRYEAFAVSGVDDASDLFAEGASFVANDRQRVVSRELLMRKGRRVVVSYRCCRLSGTSGLLGFVDPFVGTEGTGHTTPAAASPFGLVQAGPDSGWNDWAHCSGYRKDDKTLLGFSQTHLSGTGVGDLGDLRFLPYRGEVRRRDWTVRKDPDSERAEPGYYAVALPDEGLRVEIAALSKSAVYRITPDDDRTLHLFFDQEGHLGDFSQSGLASSPTGEIRNDGNRAFDAICVRNGWVTNRVVFARVEFSHPFSVAAEFPCVERGNAAVRRVYDFAVRKGEPLEVRLALSAASTAAARQNLSAQVADKSFDFVRAQASAAWAQALAGVEILEGTDDQRRNIATALYHLYLQPNDLADAGEPPCVSTLSMWDVFRAACPWYALMKPDVIDGMIASCLRQRAEVGYLPVWQLWGKDNHCMIGNHSVPVIVDAYFMGRLTDAEGAYQAVKASLTQDFAARPKDDFAVLDAYGYYPFDLIPGESVSRTLECAYDDACAARFAKALGKDADAAFFAKRAANWRNVLDASVGFARGRDTKGNWRTPFNPYALGRGADAGNDFTEGNAFQYSWHVLHDVPALIEAMGGRAAVVAKLDALFAAPEDAEGRGDVLDVTGLIGQYAHGNEPSHHVAYLYQYVGRPDRTAEVVREVFDRFYAPKPDGLCGNDDCGQMSAWYVFSALGFYPVDPTSGEYVLSAPQVPKVRLNLPNGRTFTVTARGLSRANKYVKGVTLNGNPFVGFILKRADVLAGGDLVFEMTDVSTQTACAGAVQNIDNGRQLFVDDQLIAEMKDVVRHWNAPVKAPTPVVRPTSEKDGRIAGCTVATNGGLWWDPKIGRYRLWYETDWIGNLRYAESADGLRWTFPDLGQVKGTNRVFSDDRERAGVSLDSWSVWPDYKAADPYARWCLFVSAPGAITSDTLFVSPDGRRFEEVGLAGYSGDRTTCHFDAILDKWVLSLRDMRQPRGRCRRFHALDEFRPDAVPYGFGFEGRPRPGSAMPDVWSELDEIDYGPRGSLYCFDAVPYESLMLGVMEVLHNTPRDNDDSECAGLPKQTSLRFAFSRDGRRYAAAPDAAIRPSGWGSGKWDTGYLSAVGGICTVQGDTLRFYYSALRGDATLRRARVGKQPMCRQGMYYNGAIGYATLRRDGFAGLVADGEGDVLTRPVSFTGAHLFVNVECLTGEVSAEIVGTDGRPCPGFSFADCRGLKFADTTCRELVFKGGTLSSLAGKAVQIRFRLHCATLYSFWVSPSPRGESRGFVAAGGPSFKGLRDL